jgi:DNA repair and recombination RAD54-like protein
MATEKFADRYASVTRFIWSQVFCDSRVLVHRVVVYKLLMLRRIPTTNDGKPVHRLQESANVLNKPFKPPTLAASIERVQPQRKRKRVSYKSQQGCYDDSGDDFKSKGKAKNNRDVLFYDEELLASAIPKFPVFKPKPFEEVFGATRKFSMPSMRSKDGELIPLIATNMALGTRPPTRIIPRPLHDPMEDHAIVLYDPTIYDCETDEEKKEREKEHAKEKALKDAKQKMVGMFNPHKSLRDMLGRDKDKENKVAKVPVVIDPRLTKVLRPHQVEGVKVSILIISSSYMPLPSTVSV